MRDSQIFWDLAGLAARLVPLAGFKKLPDVIKFESTNLCNLRCPVCPTNFAITREKGFLDFELFKKVIDEFKDMKKKPNVAFSMSGEPLLNRDIVRFVEYAHQNGHATYISTNATKLDRELSERLIRGGLSVIRLAIDGMSRESHEAYRIGSDFHQVKRNIEDFIKIKMELNSRAPTAVIQTLLTAFSEREVDDMIRWAREIGADQVLFKSLSMGSYTDSKVKEAYSYLLPKNKEFLRRRNGITKTLCRRPTMETVVYWNGNLGLCCVDFNDACQMPNIKERTFMETWRSKEVLVARKRGSLKQYDLCKNCSLGHADYGGFSVQFKSKCPS